MRAGIEPLRSKAQFADQINEAIEPYMNTIRGQNLDAPSAVKALMEADHNLRYSSQEQKMAHFANLARAYGVDLNGVSSQSQNAPIDQNQ